MTAEVHQGDQRIAPSALRTSIEQGSAAEERVVRVYTTVAIEEPVVTVTLTLGCATRLERRFTVFADPPLVTVAAATEALEPPSQRSAGDSAARATRGSRPPRRAPNPRARPAAVQPRRHTRSRQAGGAYAAARGRDRRARPRRLHRRLRAGRRARRRHGRRP